MSLLYDRALPFFRKGSFIPFPVRSLPGQERMNWIVRVLPSSSNLMAAYSASKPPFPVCSHHKENQYKVYGVSLVFYYEKYPIFSLGLRGLGKWT